MPANSTRRSSRMIKDMMTARESILSVLIFAAMFAFSQCKDSVPVLCTVEDAESVPEGLDPLPIAQELLSRENHPFEIVRTVIHSKGTVEDAESVPEGLDPLPIAQELLSRENHPFEIVRTVIHSKVSLNTSQQLREIQWSQCDELLIIAPCDKASTLIGWIEGVSLGNSSVPPTLVFEPNLQPCKLTMQDAHILQLSGSLETTRAIAKTLLQEGLQWRKVILIHDDTLTPAQLSLIRLELATSSVQVQVLDMHLQHKNGDFRQGFLAALKTDREHHIMLALAETEMSEILLQAKSLDLLQPHHYWILVSATSCAVSLSEPVSNSSNVLLLAWTHVIWKNVTNPPCSGHILDGFANSTMEDGKCVQFCFFSKSIILLQEKALSNCPDLAKKQAESDHWGTVESTPASRRPKLKSHLLAVGIYVILHRTEYYAFGDTQQLGSTCGTSPPILLTGPIERTQDKLSIWTADGNVTFDQTSGQLESFGLQVCSTDSFSPNGYSYVARWTNEQGFQTVEGPLYRNTFRDFSNSKDKLIVSTREAPPFVIKVKSGTEITFEGLCIDILDELAARLSFNYTIVEVEDEKWGSMDENKEWNGVVRQVMDKKASIGVGPISLMSDREKVVDYTTPYAEEGTVFMTLKPGMDKKAFFQLFRPFQLIVWIFLVLMTVGFMFAIYIVEGTSPFSGQKRGALDCIWAVYGYAVGQGTAFDLSSSSARLVLGTFWVVIIIFTSTYTADLAAVLTVNTQEEPMNTLAQLESQSEIMPLIEQGSNLQTLFFSASNGIYYDVAQMMTDMPVVTNFKDAMKMVEERNMAYISDMSQIDYIVGQDCDKFSRGEGVFNTGGLGFIVPKNAPYLPAFDGIIVKLLEAGILDEWRRKWWSHDGQTCKPEALVGTGRKLALIYLAGPLYVFAGTSGLGLLLALVEWAWRTNKCRKIRGRLRPKKKRGDVPEGHADHELVD
ncbi:glutamate receptor ionotropic, kainate 3 [Plakobranchus ocellatus]|uniref:Glutamate receptor ionotropic, kainate 3 n=1 Tax=Plakobranchus ocellatus TaxID=259542 RepID=A0AAV4ASU5_9GAST|nr:glutamate receptor ionotropic, kainate 3 [Plakobranchus ocellatus]